LATPETALRLLGQMHRHHLVINLSAMAELAQEMGHSIEIDLDHRRYVERQQLPDEQVRGRYLGQVRAPDLIDLSGEYGRVAVAVLPIDTTALTRPA
jgi:hypothetical protein